MELVKIPKNLKKLNFKFSPENELRGNSLINFIFAGKALFTLHNESSDGHVTIKIEKHKEIDFWFVFILKNNNSYKHVGFFEENKELSLIEDVDPNDVGVNTLVWFIHKFLHNQQNYPTVKVYHHGRCGRCYKNLTTPKSIKDGIGPICGKGRKLINN